MTPEQRKLLLAQRLLKTVLALSVGTFGLMVGLGNIIDYNTNWQFVRHVLSMDQMAHVFTSTLLVADRAISNALLQQASYIIIIAGELLFGLLCLLGGLCMLSAIFTNKTGTWLRGKTLFVFGCIPAVLVWHTGFAVIGGEYFMMWANQWNGQTKAYVFISFILISLFVILQADDTES